MDENHCYIFTKGKTNKQMIKLFFWNFLFSFSDKKNNNNNIELNDFAASKKVREFKNIRETVL